MDVEILAKMLKSWGEKALKEACDICRNMYDEKARHYYGTVILLK